MSYGTDLMYAAVQGAIQIAVVLFFVGAACGGFVVWLVMR